MKRSRVEQLEMILQRMSSVAGVFRIRSESVEGPRWKRIEDLMQIYIEGCRNSLKEGKDFVDEGPTFGEEDIEEARKTVDYILTGTLASSEEDEPGVQ